MPFQSQVNAQPAPGLEGGWAGVNPHFTMLTPSTGDPTEAAYASWKTGPNGCIVGRFAFAQTSTGLVGQPHPGTTGVRIGFVHRYQPVIITPYLGQSAFSLYSGQEVDITDAFDGWCRFMAGAAVGSAVYANYADGSAVAVPVGGTAPTSTFTGTTTSGSNTITAVTGTPVPGSIVTGTGLPTGTFVQSYNATAGTAVLSQQATASGTATSISQVTAGITRWTVDSAAAAGELAKISTRG